VKRSKAEKKIRKYLYDLHVTLWSDFDLHRPDSFEKAVEWLLDQVVRAGLVSDKEPQGEPSQWNIGQPLDLNIKHPVAQSADEAALDMSGPPEETSQIAFDSGFVTYKEAQTCTCGHFEDEKGGVGYMVADPDCPIHGPHAFPWRKSR
jgi:hypothetical protein